MGGWLTAYLNNTLKLFDEVLVEYYTGILEDPDLSSEEKLEVLRESLSESGSPVLTSQDKIEDALKEILYNYQNPGQEEKIEIENLDSNFTKSSNVASVEFISVLNPKAKEFKPSFLRANDDNVVFDGFAQEEEENSNNNISNTFIENFENIEPDHLIKIFEQSNFDLECTLNSLLNIGNTTGSTIATKSPSTTTLTKEKGKQMCRFFLEGTCFRKDCMFSHDLQNVICKFWMRGSCLAGDSCIFIHEIDLDRVRNALDTSYNNYTDGQVNHAIPDAFDKLAFPDLLSPSSVRTTKKTASISSPSQFASVVKRRRLSEQFPWIDSNIINSHLTTHENKLDVTAAILKNKYPRPANFVPIKAIPSRLLSSSSKRRRAPLVIKPPEHIPWLVTGSALSADYRKYRSQALACGRKRNALYERAASSYKSNRGDLAKKYSLQAQEYNLRMRELNREAARKIFDSRNNTYCKEPFIDLHGLHVDEAIEFLDESFEALELENYKGSIYIVTGTGHHSQNMKAKLGPAVREWLEELDYDYCDCSKDKKYGGVIGVEIK
ncbi:1847_t:CDS:2 [Ambispora gerdemannii]|uniref:1847_t:CDS:1 n=1 Tax=Ambispora gerdemannii TaxID=144530 RepID=A0A9N8VNJ8_9GLOM|nr:1847_t:CDS:2 [Ambispora gerdemannii]